MSFDIQSLPGREGGSEPPPSPNKSRVAPYSQERGAVGQVAGPSAPPPLYSDPRVSDDVRFGQIIAKLKRQAELGSAEYRAEYGGDAPAAPSSGADAPAGYPRHSSKPTTGLEQQAVRKSKRRGKPWLDTAGRGSKSAPLYVQENPTAYRLWQCGYHRLASAVGRCGSSVAKLTCKRDRSESYYREISCRWPGCPRCREEGSEAESRKVAKILEKFDRVQGVYRLVLTLPKAIRVLLFGRGRHAFQDTFDRKVLNKLFQVAGEFGRRVLGTAGVEVAHHPLGDSGGYNPHFEVLAPFWLGEWADPMEGWQGKDKPAVPGSTCALVAEWLKDLPRLWADALRRAFPQAADALPARVMVNGKFADSPGRIVHRVTYAVDHHWARKPKYIKTKGFRYLAALRGRRLSRGFGLLDDKRWSTWVLGDEERGIPGKPYAHDDMKREAREKAAASDRVTLECCPVHGCGMRFDGIKQKAELPWSQFVTVAPGIWADKYDAALLRAQSARYSGQGAIP